MGLNAVATLLWLVPVHLPWDLALKSWCGGNAYLPFLLPRWANDHIEFRVPVTCSQIGDLEINTSAVTECVHVQIECSS